MRNYTEDAPIDESLPLAAEMSQYTLLELLNLSEDTVRLNRAGKLSQDQRGFVQTQIRADQDGIQFLAMIFLGTLVVLAVIFLLQSLDRTALLLGGGVFLGAFAAYAYNRYQKQTQDLSVKVGKVMGDLRLIKSSTLGQWGLLISDKFFPISEALAQKFDGYQPPFVAAYYTLGTNTLLSMEVLEAEKRKNDELEGEVEKPLASWDKPKNTLAIEEPKADSVEESASKNDETPEESAAAPSSKRRF